jgi:hypothetical protein
MKKAELDLGISLFNKEHIGISSIFTGLRFYALNKKLFVNTYGCYGDRKEMSIEANYLFRNNMLLDYTYNNNFLLNQKVHHIFLNKVFGQDFQGSIGFKYKSELEEKFISLNCKKYFGKNHCIDFSSDLGLDQLIFNTKYKQRISDNFFTIVR